MEHQPLSSRLRPSPDAKKKIWWDHQYRELPTITVSQASLNSEVSFNHNPQCILSWLISKRDRHMAHPWYDTRK